MRTLPCVLGLMIALTAPALADAWIPPHAGVYLAETTDLRAEHDGTVTAHLKIDLYAYELSGKVRVPLYLLAPVDSRLVTAIWKPEGGKAVEVKPTAVTTVTWPGTVGQIMLPLNILHSGATPFWGYLNALFPKGLITWRQYMFTLEVPIRSRSDLPIPVGTLEVTLRFPIHKGRQGEEAVAWPLPVGYNPEHPEHKVETEGLTVEMVAVFDPETWRWRWVLMPSESNTAPCTLLTEVFGNPMGICVTPNEVRVDLESYRALSRYVPILMVMVPETETWEGLQSGESMGRPTRSEGRSGLPTPVPVIPIPPLFPRRRSSPRLNVNGRITICPGNRWTPYEGSPWTSSS